MLLRPSSSFAEASQCLLADLIRRGSPSGPMTPPSTGSSADFDQRVDGVRHPAEAAVPAQFLSKSAMCVILQPRRTMPAMADLSSRHCSASRCALQLAVEFTEPACGPTPQGGPLPIDQAPSPSVCSPRALRSKSTVHPILPSGPYSACLLTTQHGRSHRNFGTLLSVSKKFPFPAAEAAQRPLDGLLLKVDPRRPTMDVST